VPFVIACVVCDCESPDSYQEAVVAGWTHICYAPDAFSANFYGYCPAHRLSELERLPESSSHPRPRGNPP
jgi:hypothetical protein